MLSLSIISPAPLPLAQQTAAVAPPLDATPQRARASVVRRPVAESEATDRYLRQATRSGERSSARGRAGSSGEANAVPSRGRGLGRPERGEQAFEAAFFTPPEATHSAAFLTQVIAQEVVPDNEREHIRTREEGVVAYHAANERTATYFGPLLAFELRV